jgi:archaellum component FlaF (FlaF/FlaG flagellin family)
VAAFGLVIIIAASIFTLETQNHSTEPTTPTSFQLLLESYNWVIPSNVITLKFANLGTSSLNLAQTQVFINGMLASNLVPVGACGDTLAASTKCSYSFTAPNESWTLGAAYLLRLFTPEGAVFSYSIIAGGTRAG